MRLLLRQCQSRTVAEPVRAQDRKGPERGGSPMTQSPTRSPSSVVVVGAGLAGAKTAEALRDRGYDGPVTLIGAESDLPYERPPLSKSFLLGDSGFDAALVHPEPWYREHDVDLRLKTQATAVRPDR